MRVRRELPDDEVVTACDEDARWLTVDRGPYRLACNFADEERAVPLAPGHREVLLATAGDPQPRDGAVVLAPLSGALVRSRGRAPGPATDEPASGGALS
jgi:hypothetical protein